MKARTTIWLLLMALFMAPASYAAITPWYFSGTLTFRAGDIDSGLVGTTFAGQLQYDPAWSLEDSSNTKNEYTVPPGALSALLDGGSATLGNDGTAGVYYDWTLASNLISENGDFLLIGSLAVFSGILPDATASFINLIFFDTTEGSGGALNVALNSLPLPNPLPALTSWDKTEFAISWRNADFEQEWLAGALTCLSTNAADCARTNVPEPATLALFGLGLAGLGAVRRRRIVS